MFADATDALLGTLGLDPRASAATSRSRRTSRTSGRCTPATASTSTTQVLGADEKRLRLSHVLLRDGEDDPIATAEQMLVHVDVASGRAAPVDAAVRGRVEQLRAG